MKGILRPFGCFVGRFCSVIFFHISSLFSPYYYYLFGFLYYFHTFVCLLLSMVLFSMMRKYFDLVTSVYPFALIFVRSWILLNFVRSDIHLNVVHSEILPNLDCSEILQNFVRNTAAVETEGLIERTINHVALLHNA